MSLSELDALKAKLDTLTAFVSLVSNCVRERFAPYWHVLGIDPTA